MRRVVFNCRLFVCPGSAAVCYQNYAMLPLDCDTTLAQPRDTQGSSSRGSMVITRGSVYLSEVGAIFGYLCTRRQLIKFSVWRSPSIPALSSTGEDGTAWQRALKQFVPLAGSIMPILGGIIQSMVIIQHRAAVAKCSHPHSNSCTLGNCCF